MTMVGLVSSASTPKTVVNHPALGTCPKSSKTISEKFFGRPFDMRGYRTHLPEKWAAFLKEHFNGDVRLISFMFGVTEKCAQNWLHGIGSPRPEFVLIAICKIPEATMLLEAA